MCQYHSRAALPSPSPAPRPAAGSSFSCLSCLGCSGSDAADLELHTAAKQPARPAARFTKLPSNPSTPPSSHIPPTIHNPKPLVSSGAFPYLHRHHPKDPTPSSKPPSARTSALGSNSTDPASPLSTRPPFNSNSHPTPTRVPMGAGVIHIIGSRPATALETPPGCSQGLVFTTVQRFEYAAAPAAPAPPRAAPSRATPAELPASSRPIRTISGPHVLPSPAALLPSASSTPSCSKGPSAMSRVAAVVAELERCMAQVKSRAQQREALHARPGAHAPHMDRLSASVSAPAPGRPALQLRPASGSDATAAAPVPALALGEDAAGLATERCNGAVGLEPAHEAHVQIAGGEEAHGELAHGSEPPADSAVQLKVLYGQDALVCSLLELDAWAAHSDSHTSRSVSRAASSLGLPDCHAGDDPPCRSSSAGAVPTACDDGHGAELHNLEPSVDHPDSSSSSSSSSEAQDVTTGDCDGPTPGPVVAPLAKAPYVYRLELLNPAFHSPGADDGDDDDDDDDWGLCDSFCTCRCKQGQSGAQQQCRMCPMPMPLNPLFYLRVSGGYEPEALHVAASGAPVPVEIAREKQDGMQVLPSTQPEQQPGQEQQQEGGVAARGHESEHEQQPGQEQQQEGGVAARGHESEDAAACGLPLQAQAQEQLQQEQAEEGLPALAEFCAVTPAWWTLPGASTVWALHALQPHEPAGTAGSVTHWLTPFWCSPSCTCAQDQLDPPYELLHLHRVETPSPMRFCTFLSAAEGAGYRAAPLGSPLPYHHLLAKPEALDSLYLRLSRMLPKPPSPTGAASSEAAAPPHAFPEAQQDDPAEEGQAEPRHQLSSAGGVVREAAGKLLAQMGASLADADLGWGDQRHAAASRQGCSGASAQPHWLLSRLVRTSECPDDKPQVLEPNWM